MRAVIGKREIYAISSELSDFAGMHTLPRFLFLVLTPLIFCFASFDATAQTSRDHAVLLTMERVLGQFGITWPRDTVPTTYYVKVRSAANQDWVAYDTLTNTSPNLFVIPPSLDHAEIEVEKRLKGPDGKDISAFGYYLGHGTGNLARWQHPGRVLLVMDKQLHDSLSEELGVWIDDAQKEGWIVQSMIVPPSLDIDANFIVSDIADVFADHSSGASLTHVFIVGNIPYAYSGGFKASGPNVQPDGHPEHGGAWSSDARYTDLEVSPGISSGEQWTDVSVNISGNGEAARQENKNVPGDGKYDQSQIPTDAELCVGRLDLHNLPAFGTSTTSRDREIELIRQYFNRVHAYRTKAMLFDTIARIDDNFGVFTSEDAKYRLPEAFAAGAWRGFSAIVGRDNVVTGDFLDTIPTLLAYGCGGGGYEHCDGVANTTEFATRPIRSAFVWMFGSYFADIDSPDNIMRAALANAGNVLTCGWSGRPYWVLHPLAAMHTVGEVARESINNAGIYHSATIYTKATGVGEDYAYGQRGIHINLLGDPTLRMPAPVMTGELSISELPDDSTRIEWDGIEDALTYIIEVGKSLDVPLTTASVKGTSKFASRISTTLVLPPASRYVRVRPLFGTLTETSYTPIMGRGLIGVRDVSAVAGEGALRRPTPTAHYIDGTIVIEGAVCAPTRMVMHDLLGREVGQLSFTCGGTDLHAHLTTDLPTGVYFIRNFEAMPVSNGPSTPLTIYVP